MLFYFLSKEVSRIQRANERGESLILVLKINTINTKSFQKNVIALQFCFRKLLRCVIKM